MLDKDKIILQRTNNEFSHEIVFEKNTHEYGNIKEADGDASCEFKFTLPQVQCQ